MTAATYKYEVDWNGSGGFDGGSEDITSRVIGNAEWELGTSRFGATRQFIRSTARLILNNESGDYSSLNSSSPIFGDILPGRKVRIQATDGTGTVTMWTGEIASLIPEPRINQANIAVLTAIGPLTITGERKVQMAMSTSILTGALIDDLLDSVAWTQAYNLTVLADAPVGYWRLGESSGDAIDISGNGNDGTVTGATQGATGLLGGDTDTAYSLDGASGDVDMGSPAVLDDLGVAGRSLEFVIKASSDGEADQGIIIGKVKWWVYVLSESAGTMKLGFTVDAITTDGIWSTTNRVITVGQAHHVVLVHTLGSDPIIYVDGVSVAITTDQAQVGGVLSEALSNLIVGNRAADDRTFDGTIDEVAVYDKILTLAQAQAHNNAGVQQWRSIDTGRTTITRFAAADLLENEIQLSTALSEVAKTDNGLVYEDKGSRVVFEDRDHRLKGAHLTSQGTFSDASTTRTYTHIQQEDELLSIYNIVPMTIQLYTVGALAVLWTFPAITAGTAPAIAPGASFTVWASYPNSASVTNAFAVDAWTTPVVTTDYTFNTTAGGGGTDRSATTSVVATKFANAMKAVFTNDHATDTIYPTKIEARGTPVTKDDPINLQVEDATSQGLYRERTLSNTARWVPSVTEGDSYLNWLLVQRKDPNPPLMLTLNGNRDATHLSEVLRRTISDRITIVNANLGINGDYFIEAEHHIVNSDLIHQVTWVCSPVRAYAKSWVLNSGALNTTTGLHY